ncbi:hypothetical protein [Cupriavidus taiwanensis]|uniref:hypothetical protein n=1 Tax=Cupriavidus taiwanensis TaxID=164546 RepID=UPI000E105DF6|nr:hypothetical protein [Cupriavidus taiwanensis]SOY56838.1 hypothetical protein CBM2592_A90133 [Cupriavidus taiwanensis]SOY90759.1 hypothetical protein CBM2591_A90131 [Cupriavidus taiwanensis]SPA17055.1 hypothetical protein CBM2631_A90131 [Cupriavidus taiwanensis]SPD41790.1 conserved protein of unknown function [Cupriavidus taiwanensis]
MVNQQNRGTAADAEVDRFVERRRTGKLRGAIISFINEDGRPEHMLLDSFAEDIGAAMDQVKHLDVTLSRRFFSGG